MTASALAGAAAQAQATVGERVLPATCLVVLGVVFTMMGRMGARRTLAPNALFGIRTKRTTRSEHVWYEVHAAAAPWALAAGVVAFAGIIPILLLPEDFVLLALLLSVGVSVTLLLAGTFHALRRIPDPEDADR